MWQGIFFSKKFGKKQNFCFWQIVSRTTKDVEPLNSVDFYGIMKITWANKNNSNQSGVP